MSIFFYSCGLNITFFHNDMGLYSFLQEKANPSSCKHEGFIMEPLVGFEPTTVRLQGGCSTTELKRRNEWMRTCLQKMSLPGKPKMGGRGSLPYFKRVRRQTGSPAPGAVPRMNPGQGEPDPEAGAFLPEQIRFPQAPARRQVRMVPLPRFRCRLLPQA